MCDKCDRHEDEFVHVRRSDVNIVKTLAVSFLAGIGIAAILEKVRDAR